MSFVVISCDMLSRHNICSVCVGKTKNELMSRLSALGVSAHEKELFADDNQSPEEYAQMAREKQIDHDSDTFESMEKIKNLLVVRRKYI